MEKLNEYYINKSTCVILPINKDVSKIIELDGEYYVNKSANSIIDDSCRYFGSSYKGRVAGAKRLLNMNYKLPIIVEEYNNLIFFPTSSPRFNDCIWISLFNVKSYLKNDMYSKLLFNNNKEFCLDISYYSLENQIFRATLLESLLIKRKKF